MTGPEQWCGRTDSHDPHGWRLTGELHCPGVQVAGPTPQERAWRGEVGERLRDLRAAAGWTQRRLARVAGISVNTVSAYEHGRVPLDLAVLIRIADALGVLVTRLTEGDRP